MTQRPVKLDERGSSQLLDCPGVLGRCTYEVRNPGTPTAAPSPDATAMVTAVPTMAYCHLSPDLVDGVELEGSGENVGWT